MNILGVFGDSITWGKSDSENGGWVTLLSRFLEQKKIVWGVYNLGIDGDTSTNLLKRFDQEISIRKINKIIIAIGLNDSVYRKSTDNRETTLNNFSKNLKALVEKARKYSTLVVLMGLTKVDERYTKPLKISSTGKCYDNKIINDYDNIIKQVAEEMNVHFIGCYDLLLKEDLEDVHVNSKGHKKIFERVKNKLLEFNFFV